MAQQGKAGSLGAYIEQVAQIRVDWSPEYKELWFRGEKRNYGDTRLRPALYRPPKARSLKSVTELLDIEKRLFETFQRCSAQLADVVIEDDFDAYLLMQHHDAPTRLLDWSDGSLMALHFALRDKQDDKADSLVYVLEPYRLVDKLEALPEFAIAEQKWKDYIVAHPDEEQPVDDTSLSYLPDPEDDRGLELPRIPMALTFAHITRRVAAQRSQFIVFGADPSWLSDEVGKPDSCIRVITIDGEKTRDIRTELRECGITESVIFPDLDGLGRELRQLWEDWR
jgi:FRG domain-containing protein